MLANLYTESSHMEIWFTQFTQSLIEFWLETNTSTLHCGQFNWLKQVFHSCLLDVRLAIANSILCTSFAIYHPISTTHSWNNCQLPSIKYFCLHTHWSKHIKWSNIPHQKLRDIQGYQSSEIPQFSNLMSPLMSLHLKI